MALGNYQSYSRILVEIDLPKCENTYGVAPCTASIPTTGADKCFNCIRTCQDRANYAEGIKTLRLTDSAPDNYYLVAGVPVPVISNVTGLSITPAIVRPGIDAGERETLNISCREHADSDTQLDPYVTERSYDPYLQGTFWQRLRARYVSWEGFPLRLYRGYAGQDRDEMDVYHYSITGVTSDGKSAKITAKDPFTLADTKKSQAPRLSNGRTFLALDDNDTSITLVPTGVGNSEYPASGKVCLSGKEVCTFTRSGDTLTVVRNPVTKQEHDANATVQLVLSYVGMSGALIMADLLTNYAEGIDPSWIDSAAWFAEIDSYYGTVFTADITAPYSVAKLCNELIAQMPAVFWWDSKEQQFRLQALRPADPAAPTLDSDSFVEQSFKVSEQPDARADTVWTYFGQVDPTQKLDEVNNYATTLATVDADSSVDYNTNAIKTIQSRWIPAVARGTAQVLNATFLSRYRDPPRQISFALWRNIVRKPGLGDIYRVTHPYLQDTFGQQITIPVQLCTVKPDDSTFQCSAQEVVYVPQVSDAESGRRYVYVDHDITDVNLRALYDLVYSNLTDVTEVHLVIGSNAAVGGTILGAYALTILDADWPVGVDIYIDLTGGDVLGRGGDGLNAAADPTVGTPPQAGHAIFTDRPIFITGTGIIGGGGGAGPRRWTNYGGSPWNTAVGGAGGAGYLPGVDGTIVNTAPFAGGTPTFVSGGTSPTSAHSTNGVGDGVVGDFPGFSGSATASKYRPGFAATTGVGVNADGSLSRAGIFGGELGQAGTTQALIMTTYEFGGDYFGDTSDISNWTVGTPGQPGHAIDGISFVTIVGGGVDVRGTTT